MRTKFSSLLFVLALSLLSCNETPLVKFNSPQPDKVFNETGFKHQYQGRYISLLDSTVIRIEKDKIIRMVPVTESFNLKDSSFNATSKRSKTGIIFFTEGDTLHGIIKGDSAIFRHIVEIPFFTIDSEHLLRHFKGYYFLNSQLKGGYWEVQRLGLTDRNTLDLAEIKTVNDLQKLKDNTWVQKIDTTEHYIANPIRKEFRLYINDEGFTIVERFSRTD